MDANALTLLAVLALLVRGGHVLHAVGSVRAKSVADAAIRALVDTAVVVLAVYLAGRVLAMVAVAPGATGGFAVNRSQSVEGPAVFFATPLSLLGTIAIALVPAAIVGAATAERAKLVGGALLATLVAGGLGAVTLGAGWALVAAVDSSYVAGVAGTWPLIAAHLVGGAGAIFAARALGPRLAKYNRDGSANFIPPHNVAWLVTGDLMLIVGLPLLAALVAGDAASRLVDAILAASAAVVAAAVACHLRERRTDVILLFAAAVSGSIAGSLSAPTLPSLAILLGAIVGAVLPTAAVKLDLRFRVDDPSGLAIAHLLGATLGTFGAALGVGDGATPAREIPAALGIALAMIVIALVIGGGGAWGIAALLRRTGWLRIDDRVEEEGIDLALHDVNAYPDFQQTMIKSYHLRQ